MAEEGLGEPVANRSGDSSVPLQDNTLIALSESEGTSAPRGTAGCNARANESCQTRNSRKMERKTKNTRNKNTP